MTGWQNASPAVARDGALDATSAVGETAPPAAVDWAAMRAVLGGVDVSAGPPAPGRWAALAEVALAGAVPDRDTARAVLSASGADLGHLLGAAFVVRERAFGRRVKLCVLENARSGLCPEDCHYCSQSAVSTAEIARYRLRTTTRLVAAARRAADAGARRFCMVVSGRGPSDADIERFAGVAQAVRSEIGDIELCVSSGLMRTEQAARLRAAGVDFVNHNLNTGPRHYPAICSTHTYDDRLATLRGVRAAGLALCSGVIMGMGETDDDLVDAAEALRELQVESLPVNFLHPIDGTPLAGAGTLPVERALAGVCLFRLFNPTADIRAAGGRERTLGACQPLVLYAATSIFADGYLTTPGQPAAGAQAMVGAMGFSVET